jgi:hypothetical protein
VDGGADDYLIRRDQLQKGKDAMAEKRRGRVRFVECRLESRAKGVRVQVVLASHTGKTFTGVSEGEGERGREPDLWHAAVATVDALRQVLTLGADTLVLRDAVPFELGDHSAVAVELRAMRDGEERQLRGMYHVKADRVEAAALAVLAATNRTFGERARESGEW